MRDANRLDKFYDEMKAIHKECFPDWRFIQTMINFINWIVDTYKIDGFYFEENKTLDLFKEFAYGENSIGER